MMTAAAERALEALGDPTRRLVLERLRHRPRSVQEIADGMSVSRPAVSQHLKVLRTAGLVVAHAEGTRRLYAVDAAGLRAVRKWLDGFWDQALAAFVVEAEREATLERSRDDRKKRSRQRRCQ
jgi:DNA-binding transcriptional ArsR family regulator